MISIETHVLKIEQLDVNNWILNDIGDFTPWLTFLIYLKYCL